MNVRRIFALACTMALVPFAQAQQMKPGLWEVATKVELSPEQQKLMEKTQASMKSVLEKMPPAERKRVEEGMASSNQAQVSQACLTEADVKADRPPGKMPESCKFSATRSGHTMNTKFSCDAPKVNGTGVFEFESGGTVYTSRIVSEMGTVKTTMTARGRWLGADCKGIKSPAEMMKK